MTFVEKITGSDLTAKYKEYENRVKLLPEDYQRAWNRIYNRVSMYSDFTGRNLLVIFDQVIDLLEEMNSIGKNASEVFGDDIDGFCDELTAELTTTSIRDKWRNQLNSKVSKKLK